MSCVSATETQYISNFRTGHQGMVKAGWVFEGNKEESDFGTPQGSVISPLLANVALHGMENRMTQLAESLKGDKVKNRTSLTFVRYADDFVCLHPDQEV